MKLYAFWKYDLFPYLLHGEVTEGPDDQGRIQADGYGSALFSPLIMLPYPAGEELGIKLDHLRADYDQQVKAVDDKFRVRLNGMLPPSLQRAVKE